LGRFLRMSIAIRSADAVDIPAIVAMARELNAQEGVDPTLVDPGGLAEHAFGPHPRVSGLIAELDGAVVGYALYQDFFDTDYMRPALFLHDLFVKVSARRRGVGHRLMAALAAESLARGANLMAWAVRFRNSGARAFYDALKARNEDARVLELGDHALRALAEQRVG